MFQDVSFVVCLDSLGSDKNIYAHVSKPPKDDTKMGRFMNVILFCYIIMYQYCNEYTYFYFSRNLIII